MTTEPSQPFEDDEIDLAQLLHTLWLQRIVIASIALIGALLGGLAGQFSTKYVSEAVLQTGEFINASNYKRYEPTLRNAANLKIYLERSPQINKEAAELLLSASQSPTGMQELIKPEFALTAKDQKSFGISSSADNSGAMIGLRLSFEDGFPSLGRPILVLGDYVRDTLLRLDVEAYVVENCQKNRAFEQSMRIEKIKGELAIEQEKARAKTLRGLKGGSSGSVNQLISIEKGGERFLSPQAQINASEITISELLLEQVTRENDVKISEIRKAYYCGALQIIEKPISMEAVVEEMKVLEAGLFKTLDSRLPFVEQTANEFQLLREGWEFGYLRGLRFISDPTHSEAKIRKVGRASGLLLGAMLGVFLGILFAFIRKWWQSKKSEITAN